MAGLIPIGGHGGGPVAGPTCFHCGADAQGPCASCRVLICAADECSVVVKEPGLPDVVLCTDCAKFQPLLASRRWLAPALGAAGAVLGAAVALTWSASWLTGVGVLSASAFLLLGAATALARWQWRSRLRSARLPTVE